MALPRRRSGVGTGAPERGRALGEILDDSLYLGGGYRSESAFLAAEAPDLDPRTARTYVRVAKFFEPEDEARYGIAKLDLLLAYLEAADIAHDDVPAVARALAKIKTPD